MDGKFIAAWSIVATVAGSVATVFSGLYAGLVAVLIVASLALAVLVIDESGENYDHL